MRHVRNLFFAASLLFIGQRASACSCAAGTVRDTREWADVVFSGIVKQIQYVDTEGEKVHGERRIIVTFSVSEYWKGDAGETLTLYTVHSRVSCSGLVIKEGEKWLVYARHFKAKSWLSGGNGRQTIEGTTLPEPDDEVYRNGACGRTSLLRYANKDLKALKILGNPKKEEIK